MKLFIPASGPNILVMNTHHPLVGTVIERAFMALKDTL